MGSSSTSPEPDAKLQAAGDKIQELIKSGFVTGMAFIVTMKPFPGSGDIPYAADVVGDISSHRLLASGICEELKELVKK